jgi:hypothetical protein
VARLAGLLERHGLLVEGRVRVAAGAVPETDRREIAAVLRYLAETHGTRAIAPWFGGAEALARVDTVAHGTAPSADGERRARVITEHLGLEYVGWSPDRHAWFSLVADTRTPVPVGAYDTLLVVRHPSDSVAGPGLHAWSGPSGRSLVVFRDGVPLTVFPVDSLLRGLRRPTGGGGPVSPIPAAGLTLAREVPGLRLLLQIGRVDGNWNADTLVVRELTGVLLVGRR